MPKTPGLIKDSTAEKIAAYVGIDWADKEHETRMLVVDSGKIESLKLKQKPEALADWVADLRARFAGRKVAVAIEQRRGALIYVLMKYDFLILYPVNPKALARYREAFHPSGSKSDAVDAELLMDMLRLHRDKLRAWVPEETQMRLMQMLVEERRHLVDQVTRLTNRVKATLKQYYPQALEWAGELKSQQALDFLTRWPTLDSLRRAKPASIEKFYTQHGLRNREKIQERMKAIAEAKSLTTDDAVVTASRMKVEAIVGQLRPLLESIADFDQQIAQLFNNHPDREVFSSFPCAKEVLAPRLCAAFGGARERWDGALEIQSFSGIAPVTKSSGNSRTVQKRRACPKFLRQTFHEYAGQSIKKGGWARAYYQELRDRGVKHHAAVRALAYKWIRIMYRCWQEQEPYSEEKYVAALKRRNSRLAAALGQAARAGAEV